MTCAGKSDNSVRPARRRPLGQDGWYAKPKPVARGEGGELEEGSHVMGDKGKKDKDKGQKQKLAKQAQDAQRKFEKQPKRVP